MKVIQIISPADSRTSVKISLIFLQIFFTALVTMRSGHWILKRALDLRIKVKGINIQVLSK
jgi:hypothetical protein